MEPPKGSSVPGQSLDLVPKEIGVQIFQHLSVQEVSRLCTVSRRLQALADDNALWRVLVERTYGKHSDDQIEALLAEQIASDSNQVAPAGQS